MTSETRHRSPNAYRHFTWLFRNAHSTASALRKSAQSNVSASVGKRSAAETSKSLVLQGERVYCLGRLHYLVKSKSEDGWHCVDLEPNEDYPPGCTCTSFRVRGSCRHMRVIRAHLGLDGSA